MAGCAKDGSAGAAVSTGFEPVEKEDGQKFKLPETQRSSDAGTKQTSTLRWSIIFEEIGTGQQSVNLRLLFAALSKLTDADYDLLKVGEDTNRLDNISYFVYGTPYLWWAVRIANFSRFSTPFSTIPLGTNIKVPKREALFLAMKEVSNI